MRRTERDAQAREDRKLCQLIRRSYPIPDNECQDEYIRACWAALPHVRRLCAATGFKPYRIRRAVLGAERVSQS